MNIKDFQSQAEFFHVLSHPVRLQILNELRKQSCCVCHLQVVTRRPQAYVSQQLRVLRDAGLVDDDKDGQNVYYRLCHSTINVVLDETLGPVEPEQILPDCTCPRCLSKSL
jgi:ArsR family transcriptional regulator